MVLLFITLQIGFHPTYFMYFPDFKKFTWLHHIHGALMASWIILLVVQPILIHKKHYATHRFLGKLSYFTAPMMIVSMFLILRFTYHKYISSSSIEVQIANQASIIMQLFSFTVLYALAIIYRKNTFYHQRFMIGTALLMLTPTLGRVFYEYFEAEIMYEMYISIGIAALLCLYDFRKKNGLESLRYCNPGTLYLCFCVSFSLLRRLASIWAVCGEYVLSINKIFST